jgi:K+-transporting ATPase KdpF subunit
VNWLYLCAAALSAALLAYLIAALLKPEWFS